MRALATLLAVLVLTGCSPARLGAEARRPAPDGPFVVVLGIGQDGGVPQTGDTDAPGWTDPGQRRLVVSLGLVDPASGSRWLMEATPDLPEQLVRLAAVAPRVEGPVLDGIFLTHAHIGHYTGLMFLGHESLGARGIPVYAMPRMADFLRTNGPWSQLVRYENVAVQEMADGVPVPLAEGLTVTPFLVPHRQEFSEVVGFRIDGPRRSVLFLPDIDSWHEWDAAGTRLEDALATVDVAYLDATFFADGEIPGRDMSGFPHPFVTTTMARLAGLPASERAKVRFLHLNHTNPALWPGPARDAVEAAGMRVAEEGETVAL
jgi:pyrroloquinoline quinone biosynthesis protein B